MLRKSEGKLGILPDVVLLFIFKEGFGPERGIKVVRGLCGVSFDVWGLGGHNSSIAVTRYLNFIN
jgi:hypothetical protein